MANVYLGATVRLQLCRSRSIVSFLIVTTLTVRSFPAERKMILTSEKWRYRASTGQQSDKCERSMRA